MKLNKKLFSINIPYIIFILIILNAPLSTIGIHYLYAIVLLFGIIGMLIIGIKKYKSINFIVVYIYIFSLFSIFYIQLFFYDLKFSTFQSLLMYIVMILYWSIYFNKYTTYDFKSLIIKIVPIVYLVGFLGVLQYFFSPTLFGLIDEHHSKGIEWANSMSFGEYVSFFRASSILGSPQVYGLFISLFIILIQILKITTSFIGIAFLLFAGILSGNKSFLLIIGIYYIYSFLKNNSLLKLKKVLLTVIFLIITIFINIDNNDIGTVNRLFNIDKIVQQEEKDSRLERYINIINNNNILIGSGFGTKTDRNDLSLKVAESYIFQILSEVGVIGLIFFLLLIFFSFLQAKNQYFKDMRILISSIFISMIIVHAFNSPVFYIFWGVIISSYAQKDRKVIYENYN